MNIRVDQIKTFERDAWRTLELELVARSHELAPEPCALLDDGHLHSLVRSNMARALHYNFTNRGPIRLFHELTLLCGISFDTDPQFPIFGELLRTPADQMYRAHMMHEHHNEYLDQVVGPGGGHVRKALRRLTELLKSPPSLSSTHLDGILFELCERIFPEKARHAGRAGVVALVARAQQEGPKYGLADPREIAVMVGLMLAFGHGCTSDPLYYWISAALEPTGSGTSVGPVGSLEAEVRRRTIQATKDAEGNG